MKGSAGLWWAVGAAFALLGCAWAAMFFFSRQAKIKSVELPVPAAVHGQAR